MASVVEDEDEVEAAVNNRLLIYSHGRHFAITELFLIVNED